MLAPHARPTSALLCPALRCSALPCAARRPYHHSRLHPPAPAPPLDAQVNLLVTAALIIHNLPEGLAVAAALALKPNSRISPAAACLLASLTSLPQPLVGLGCCWLLQAEMHPLVPCLLTAASVGAILWVAMADLFVESAASLGGLSAMAIVAPTAALMLVHHALTED